MVSVFEKQNPFALADEFRGPVAYHKLYHHNLMPRRISICPRCNPTGWLYGVGEDMTSPHILKKRQLRNQGRISVFIYFAENLHSTLSRNVGSKP